MEEAKKILTITDENGNKTEAEILIAFRLDLTNKEYVIYTLNEKDENGNVTIYAASLIGEPGAKEIAGIDTDEEWEKMKEIIKELSKVD